MSAPPNTSNTPGTAPPRTSTSTTRPEHASRTPKRRSIATTPGFGSAALSTMRRSCDDRSKRSSCGIDTPAATPSTSSNSATPSNSSPAAVAETSTPTSSERSAKRHRIGPTTPASTCHPRGDTAEPANEPGLDSTCSRMATRSGRPRSETKSSPVPGSCRSRRTVENRARRSPQTTKSGWVVPTVPSIQPRSVAVAEVIPRARPVTAPAVRVSDDVGR